MDSSNTVIALCYADQRFYNSQYGRFMSADAYQRSANATDSASWNKYSYVGGDPINRTDRKGMYWDRLCDEDAFTEIREDVTTKSLSIGGLNRESLYDDWNQGIKAAATTVDHRFEAGFVTVQQLYSGAIGAYCFGNCVNGESNVEKTFKALGGGDPNNYRNLLWQCNE